MTDTFKIKLPDELKIKIKISAARNKRTMNAEVLSILEKALGEAK